MGDVLRGAKAFANAKSACVSCHRVGRHGGNIGPDLTTIGRQRDSQQIAESLLWPDREVKPEFVVWNILTIDGKVITGYRNVSDDGFIEIRDLASGKTIKIARDDVEEEAAGASPMPAGLTTVMTRQQQRDVIRFLSELGRNEQPLSHDLESALAHSQMHGPASFPLDKAPIDPSRWTHSGHAVNRDRIFDFYTKQAEHFRKQQTVPMLLSPFPGLDGGNQGHWGNQNDKVWSDGRWNDAKLGSVQAGVFHAKGTTIPRGVCVQLGENGELSACFNPDTLTYDVVWSDGFVDFSPFRHGFIHGLRMKGKRLPLPKQTAPTKPFTYHGFYRYGNRVVFAYRIGDVEYLDSPWVSEGQLTRDVAPADEHPFHKVADGGPAQWPQILQTRIVPGQGKPFAIDTIELPFDNPWKAPLFLAAHDFLPDGRAVVSTMQGDVWIVDGLKQDPSESSKSKWRRFASGLHYPLGLVVTSDGIFVQCRDQLTRLTDLNGDDEADFYECYSNAFVTSAAGHDYICGLQRDEDGYFYTASGNQGLVRISPDGQRADVLATGFRNPDGLGILSDGTVTVPCSEGGWTPASMICAVPRVRTSTSSQSIGSHPPYFGFRGPRDNQPPALPLTYLPRGLDNSSGGQTIVPQDVWGPLQQQLLHFSFGTGSWFVVLRDEVDGQMQGAVVPMAGDFHSGAHRGRFSPHDNHLYVSGMQGWGSYTPDDGCFQRIRHTGDTFQTPTGFHAHENGVQVTFAQPVDPELVSDVRNHFAQCWNYRYSGAYGSPEYSPMHPGVAGHDPLAIASAHVLADGRSIFLQIPDLQPVNQLHLRLHVNRGGAFPVCSPAGSGHDLFVTVHKLDAPLEDFPGYKPIEKTIAAHPILSDMALNSIRVPNLWRKKIQGARSIELKTGKNLTYATREITVGAGEPIALKLVNPDVVPHNWALVRAGTLRTVGELANRLISNPKAFARHYIPETDDILFHTDVVGPGKEQTIFFHAPKEPGRYPFLCTFPGHWMVMNGEMIVK